MVSNESKKLNESSKQLADVLERIKDKQKCDRFEFLAVAKAFEVAVEDSWRELKRRVEDEGLDAPSPKEAVRQAARTGMISSAEDWLDCINARNDSVHNYFGISEDDYTALAKKFLVMLGETK